MSRKTIRSWSHGVARIHAIARNTFIEASRNRAFVGLAIAAVGLVGSGIALSQLAIRDQAARVLVDFGLFAISLLSVVIATVMGVILIFKEVDRKTFYLVLSKPVRRSEVVAGKFFGLLAILVVTVVGLGAAWMLSLWSRDVPLHLDMVKALILIGVEAALMTAVALFFSSFATPIMSGVFTIGIFLVGRSVALLDELLSAKKGMLVQSPFARAVARLVTATFPDLSTFHVGKQVILGLPVGWDYVGAAALYALGYIVLFLALGMLIFQRKDFV